MKSAKGTDYEMFYQLDAFDQDYADSESYPLKKKDIGYEEFARAMRNILHIESWPSREGKGNIPDW